VCLLPSRRSILRLTIIYTPELKAYATATGGDIRDRDPSFIHLVTVDRISDCA
jgi:hypothetical protein